MLIGFFSSLLRGGAVFVQLFAAFYAQGYKQVLPYLRRVFFVRFLIWFLIGLFIILFGQEYHNATLFAIGIGFFIFSFSAGFGAIYFKELVSKIFSHRFRGKTMAYRQFFTGLGAIISGGIAGWVLQNYKPPLSFGYLFLLSSFLMAIGFISFGTIKEPIKEKITQKEKSFKKFLQNALNILKGDKALQYQVLTFLFAYGYLAALPFIILDAKDKIELDGVAVGSLITAQMLGAMFSNFIWGKLSSQGKNKLITLISLSLMIIGAIIAMFASHLYIYMLIFALFGASTDGNRISGSNMLLQIAPEDKRPIYVAININILSFGMFFSVIGGVVVHLTNYTILYIFTLLLLLISLFFAFKLEDKD